MLNQLFQSLTRRCLRVYKGIIYFCNASSSSRRELRLTILIIRDILDDLHDSFIIAISIVEVFNTIGIFCFSGNRIYKLILEFFILFFRLINISSSRRYRGHYTSSCCFLTGIGHTKAKCFHIGQKHHIILRIISIDMQSKPTTIAREDKNYIL